MVNVHHNALKHCHSEGTNCSAKVRGAFYEQHRIALLERLSNVVGSLFAAA